MEVFIVEGRGASAAGERCGESTAEQDQVSD